jgi:putative NIF3 family GTP cyclohydrolase 1 type 2
VVDFNQSLALQAGAIAALERAPEWPERLRQIYRERRDRMVQTIAVCGGAGESLYASIKDQADIYVTSDIRHHMFVSAYGEKCTLWDAGHRETEVPGTKQLATLLSQHVSVPVTWIAEPNV